MLEKIFVLLNIQKTNDSLSIVAFLDSAGKNLLKTLSVNKKGKKSSPIWKVPSYRNDIKAEPDLYEEVARVYGYDKIPSSTVFSNNYTQLVSVNDLNKQQIQTILSSRGFNEHYSNSLYNHSQTN